MSIQRVLWLTSLKIIFIAASAFFFAYILFFCFGYKLLQVHKNPPKLFGPPIVWSGGYFKYLPGIYNNEIYKTTATILDSGFRKSISNASCYKTVAIGESSTADIEVNDRDTWPSKFGTFMGDSCVLNAGIGGSVSSQHLKLWKDIIQFQPQRLIYYSGRNDHAIESRGKAYPGPKNFPWGFVYYLKSTMIYWAFYLESALFVHFNNTLKIIPVNDWKRDYKQNLYQIINDARDGEVCVLMVQQIMQFPKIIQAEIFNKSYKDAKAKAFNLRDDSWLEYYRQIELYEIQSDIAKQKGLEFISTADLMFNEDYFYDLVHLTPKGYEALALRVSENIFKCTVPK